VSCSAPVLHVLAEGRFPLVEEHIPVESDLVLVELGINDLLEIDVLDDYEHLVRGILELPGQPAIINVETFSILFPTLVSSSGLHGDVNAFYDVPSIAIRDVILPRIGLDPDVELPKWFRTGDDVKVGDSKVREWGGVPIDLMHVRRAVSIGGFPVLILGFADLCFRSRFSRFSGNSISYRASIETICAIPATVGAW
jgi:hypothetical protein